MYGCEVFHRRKAWVLSFLWQLANALVDARCCRLGHTQLLPLADMEKGVDTGHKVVGRSAGARVPEQLGGKGRVAVWVLLSSVAIGEVAHWVPPCPILVDGCRDLTN